MDYPKNLIDEAALRIKGYQVEGFVAGQGPLRPKLMLIGEAPGKTEVENHIPFSGQAGKELMNALKSVGLSREDVYITSAVRSRPYRVVQRTNRRTKKTEIVYPNRTPSKAEVFAHAPILDYEIQHVKPQLIATLGNIGLQRMLGKEYTISTHHGKLYTGPILELNQQHDAYQYSKEHYRLLPLFHPAAIFYNRTLTETIVADWQKLGELLNKEL